MSDEQLKGALRALLLPIRPEREDEAIDAASGALAAAGVAEADFAEFLRIKAQEWRASEGPKPDLAFVKSVRAYLREGEPGDLGKSIAAKYFDMHKRLSARPQFDHGLASALLSHARLIAVLAIEDRLSAAQISQFLLQRDPRSPSSWESVQLVLGAIGHKPKLVPEQVEELFFLDAHLEEEWFGDANLDECIELIGRVAIGVGIEGNFESALGALVVSSDCFPPYMKMLHFLCFIAEYYDHPLKFAYEFSPRGEVAKWVSGQYPSAFGKTGSPFLNNAKSVDALDRSWASSKKPAVSSQAFALVTIVESLSNLCFSARRELATWIRRLLARVIRLARRRSRVKLPTFTARRVKKVIEAVCEGPTNTFGILEQRVVDAVGALRHGPPAWVPRGLGDSVNATNFSKRKCGDCDFQDAATRRVVAFEPHAGSLTSIYVKDHELTLERVLTERTTEWQQTVGGRGPWKVDVVFVAHEVPGKGTLGKLSMKSAGAEIRAVPFDEFLGEIDVNSDVVAIFNERVRVPLMEGRTPEKARKKAFDLMS